MRFVLMLMLLSATGVAKPLVLFDKQGNPVPEYDTRVTLLKQGNTIQFSDTSYRIGPKLGGDQSTRIHRLDDGRAIRLALKVNLIPRLDDYLVAYQQLKHTDAPMVRVFPTLSKRGQRVITEELFPDPEVGRLMTLKEFAEGAIAQNSTLFARMAVDLVKFAEETAFFVKFGDQGARQVVYCSRGWVLADFSTGHQIAQSAWEPIAFCATPAFSEEVGSNRSCGSLLSTSLLLGLHQSSSECRLSVPPTLEYAVRLAVLRKRLEEYGYQTDGLPLNGEEQPIGNLF